MPRPFPEPVMLTVAEAAARLGVSEQRVRTLITQGRIPARKHGLRAWGLMPKDVDRFAESGRYTGRAGGKPPKLRNDQDQTFLKIQLASQRKDPPADAPEPLAATG